LHDLLDILETGKHRQWIFKICLDEIDRTERVQKILAQATGYGSDLVS
jgi:hypothetical protein